MQYLIFVREKSYGHGRMIYHNCATLHEAKEEISEEFKNHPAFQYAEIYDRSSGETMFRTRQDSEYRIVIK